MASPGNPHAGDFPTVPPSLSAGDHEMRDNYDAQNNQRPTPHTISNITPYLGLRARLSQVWINRWTILLLLILVRVLIAISGLHNDLGSAKTEAMSACTSVEDMGSTMASMPHYLSAGVNELASASVEKAVHGLMSMLLMTVTGVEEILVFYVNMLTGTYMCLITFVVAGALHAALSLLEDVSGFLNSTLHGIGDDLASVVGDFQKDFNGFAKGINSIPEAFGKKGGIPTLNVTSSIDKLQNLELPANLTADLNKLNSSIPTFQDVQNFTDNIIRMPFEEVKKLVNGTLQFSFDRSILPVPQKEQLTFCTDNNGISKFFDDLAHIAEIAKRVFLTVLLILAIAACVPMAIQEMRRWRTMKERAELVADKSFDPMDVIYIASRPYTATAGIKVAAPFKNTRRQILVRWVVAYATSTPALLVLSLGVTGLLACLCQYILLKIVVKEVPALTHEIGDFADLVVNKLNNASESWANGTNAAIMHVNNDINHNVLGWVNTTTGAINGTLNAFIDETTKVLNETFGGTILYKPVTGIFECLIGLKVASIQKGLTWVSDNAVVDFPGVNGSVFSLGAAASLADSTGSGKTNTSGSFLSSPGSDAEDKITAAVAKVAQHLADAIETEAIISLFIVLLYVIIVLIGIGRALFLAYKPDRSRGEGGSSYAGDIPLEEQNSNSHSRGFSMATAGPAPAYEPPQRHTNPFGDPFSRAGEPGEASSNDGRPDSEVWQDEKLGFGGSRAPEQVEAPKHASVYPPIEKSY